MAEDVKAVAWLVANGRTFVDRAFVGIEAAEHARDTRNDGAEVQPLYPQQAIDALRAERDAAIRGEHRTDDTQPTWAELVTYWRASAERAEAQAAELREAWLHLRQQLLIRDGMRVEQARIHAEVEMARREALARAGKGVES